jgi:predicted AlkP superfamily phosphohydrolase/phosphomutase
MPISHPKIFSVYLAKKLKSFATLGMAEDTTAVNEKVLSENTFLQQVYGVQEEREKSFFDTLKRIKKGLVIQVFETTDRIQHMFWRYLPGADSPAEKESKEEQVREAIYHSYKKMDDFLGKLLPKLRKNDFLFIVSDHGFGAFNRGFHLNSWLAREGYLVLKEGKKESGKWFADVDWSKSRAYGQGLNGLYLNMKGREKLGIVSDGEESHKLIEEIKGKLEKLVDSKTKQKVIGAVYKREQIYRGPYTPNAPDIVLGYRYGHRVSWESSVNFVGSELFSDNTRYWSGDHAFTRDQVPGVLFSNRKVKDKDPALMDIAPTVLSSLGIQPPAHMDGKCLEME